MDITRLVRSALASAAAAAVLGFAGPVQATSFSLGSITSPTSLGIGNEGLRGVFFDSFTFSIAQGTSLSFSSSLSSDDSNRSFIPIFQAGLFSDGHLVAAGHTETSFPPGSFPSRDISFASLALGPGDYRLGIVGLAIPFSTSSPFSSSYHGLVDFASIGAPAPEPEAFMLMAFGLGVVGFLRRRRTARAGVAEGRGQT